MKHIPGIWKKTYFGKINAVHAADGSCVATCESSTADNEANAHLIAAAPELLEALENVMVALKLKNVKLSDYLKNQADAAIAKAKSESK